MRNPVMNMDNSSRLFKLYMVLGFACVLLVFFVMDALEPVDKGVIEEAAFSTGNITSTARKLLDLGDGNDAVNRIGVGVSSCGTNEIVISQGPDTPLPSGIPTYAVAVSNLCIQGSCTISDVHLSCGWFSSARLINPRIFRRIAYDDCLVNDGKPLNPGETVMFKYANTFPYKMAVSSVKCN